MSRLRLVLVGVGIASCGGEAPPLDAPSAAPPPRASATVAADAPSTAPRGQVFSGRNGPLPAWLDPDFDERSAAFRVRLRAVSLYAGAHEAALNEDGPARTDRTEPVVDEPSARESERVRVLCTTTRDRVHLWVNRAGLALRTRKGSFLAAREDELERGIASPASFAGLELDAGVDVGATREADGPSDSGRVVEARVRDDNTKIDGFVARRQLDEVWEWPPAVVLASKNARIPRDATFFDVVGGKPFATLPAIRDGEYEAWTDPAVRGPMVFVRARTSIGILGGWISASKVVRADDFGLVGTGSGGASHLFSGSRTVELPRGTLFYVSDEPIGVVKTDGRYRCTRFCDDARPTIELIACGQRIQLGVGPVSPLVRAAPATSSAPTP